MRGARTAASSAPERLAGNVGYPEEITHFAGPWLAGKTAVHARSASSPTPTRWVLDLRGQRGGYPQMAQLVASYLFDGWQVQLLLRSTSARRTRRTSRGRRRSSPGRRFGEEKPLYVLDERRDHLSCGEALRLRFSRRSSGATAVGEVTAGAANPGRVFPLGDHFDMQIAEGRAVNPVTKTNWGRDRG